MQDLKETKCDSKAVAAKCQLCASSASEVRPFSEWSGEKTSLYQCPQCKTGFLFPQPSDDWLANEYQGYYQRRQTPGGKAANFRAFFNSHDPTRFTQILEIGGGEGDCARVLHELAPQAHLTVIESHPDCRPFYSTIDCKLEVSSLEAWLNQQKNDQFDLILCFDVLEHLRDPAKTLRELTAHLQPGGELWATFPNFDSTSRHLFQRFWPQFKTEHLFYFSRGGVERLASESGLSIQELVPHQKTLSVNYLLNVGSSFGPAPLKAAVQTLRSLTPELVAKQNLRFQFGEWLLIARKVTAE